MERLFNHLHGLKLTTQMESINIHLPIGLQMHYTTNSECCLDRETTTAGVTGAVGWRTTSGSPLFHSGLIARDGLCRIDASTEAVHTLEIRVAQRSKGRYPPGGVEGKELLENKEQPPHPVNTSMSGISKSCMAGEKQNKT